MTLRLERGVGSNPNTNVLNRLARRKNLQVRGIYIHPDGMNPYTLDLNILFPIPFNKKIFAAPGPLRLTYFLPDKRRVWEDTLQAWANKAGVFQPY
jgi:hypothetical protein